MEWDCYLRIDIPLRVVCLLNISGALLRSSSINSQKPLWLWKITLFMARPEKEACERNNVAQSYFSISVKSLLR
ncbi:PapB/FocB family fimbrial expression transcriptional regulator [Escherichia coli]